MDIVWEIVHSIICLLGAQFQVVHLERGKGFGKAQMSIHLILKRQFSKQQLYKFIQKSALLFSHVVIQSL